MSPYQRRAHGQPARRHQRHRLAIFGFSRSVEEPDAELRSWVLDHLYRAAGSIARSHDRYATLLTRHPLPLG
jgi:hypothetical protein